MVFCALNLTVVACIVLIVACETRQASFYATYKCIDGTCQRSTRPIDSVDSVELKDKGQHTTLSACRLICDGRGALWPLPSGPFTIGKNYVEVHPRFHFDFRNVSEAAQMFLRDASNVFLENIEASCRCNGTESAKPVAVRVSVGSESLDLDWTTREDYIMQLTKEDRRMAVSIEASTVFGARHALETLSQLTAPAVTSGGGRSLVMVAHARITDWPVFPHRGLLVDTARNFLPVKDILRTIDGLAATKMNVLHWHATDSQSFPLEIKSLPAMARFGAYGPDKIYTAADMSRIVSYGKSRGVRVILELDSPSHAGAGWNWGELAGLGKLAVCVNEQPWHDFCIQPPCGQLNPVNPNTYKVLQDIYQDVLEIWGRRTVLHLGGDEVFYNCWNATPEVTSEMSRRGMGHRVEDFLKLWGEFHASQLEILDSVRGNSDDSIVLWSSHLTTPGIIERYLNASRVVVQTWVESNSELPRQLIELGYRLIVSTKNAWYLDHGFWGRTNYHTWRDAYLNRIPRSENVLGGEACMWGEYVNGGSLDSRVWPRAAAVGERLWSDPAGWSTSQVESRLQAHRERLQTRDIQPDAIAPEWCAQHERQCS